MNTRHIYRPMTAREFQNWDRTEFNKPLQVGDVVSVVDPKVDVAKFDSITNETEYHKEEHPFVRVQHGGFWNPQNEMGLLGYYLVSGVTEHGLKVFVMRPSATEQPRPVLAVKLTSVGEHYARAVVAAYGDTKRK